MKVLCTGISGDNRREYLVKTVEYAKEYNEDIEILDVGKLMFKTAEDIGIQTSEEKILDLSPTTLRALRATVFEKILSITGRNGNYIINTHACFRWKKYLTPAFDVYYLNQIDPDIYITIVDFIASTKARLDASRQWKGRLSLKELLIWRDEEIFITQTLAEYQRKPFYIIGREQPPETLYKLMFRPEMKKIYLSFPITYMRENEEKMREVQEFRDRLRENFIVFDPMTIKDLDITIDMQKAIGEGKDAFTVETDAGPAEFTVEEVKMVEKDLADQTVARDYKLINQSDYVVVYYPVKLPSPGVLNEMNYGFSNNKKVYAVYPFETSPFFEYYSTRIFRSADELISYLLENESK